MVYRAWLLLSLFLQCTAKLILQTFCCLGRGSSCRPAACRPQDRAKRLEGMAVALAPGHAWPNPTEAVADANCRFCYWGRSTLPDAKICGKRLWLHTISSQYEWLGASCGQLTSRLSGSHTWREDFESWRLVLGRPLCLAIATCSHMCETHHMASLGSSLCWG